MHFHFLAGFFEVWNFLRRSLDFLSSTMVASPGASGFGRVQGPSNTFAITPQLPDKNAQKPGDPFCD